MADLDPELLERVARWCAEAGRQAGAAGIRRALAPLSWDELLALRALLADPPPTRPLGPYALADLARGSPADVAAERERGGRYPSTFDDGTHAEPPPPIPTAGRPPSRKRAKKGRAIVIRRARDAVPPSQPPAPSTPLVDALLLPEGRAVLERLLRRNGARRPALLAALAASWTRPDGGPPDDEDLSRLLDHHGLAHAFARRERDELLHALRAAGGVRTQAAQRLGVDAPALEAALARLGATADAERIRDERRAELRARATISERVHLLLVDAARLEDLGMLAEVEDDLRRRLPEHVRALPGGAPLALALSRSLTLTPPDAQGIVERFGLARPALGAPAQAAANARGRPPGLARPRAPQHARGKDLGGRRGPGGARGSTPPRAPGAARGPGGPRGAGAPGRPGGPRGAGAPGRPGGPRGAGASGRPGGSRGSTAPRAPGGPRAPGAGRGPGAARGPGASNGRRTGSAGPPRGPRPERGGARPGAPRRAPRGPRPG